MVSHNTTPPYPAEVQQWLTLQNGLGALYQSTAPMPVPGPDEVLVAIHALSLNYRDTEVIAGDYNHHSSLSSSSPPQPLVPCSDMCGTILALGPGPHTIPWTPGERVLSIFNQTHLTGAVREQDMASGLGKPLQGCLQTHRVFKTTGLVKAPGYLSDEEASCLPIAGVTAWMSLHKPDGQRVGEGETVLCLGTGGVSVAGMQIARACGAETIITSSSDAKLAKAASLGATHTTLNYLSLSTSIQQTNIF